jgi:hypothetical protein
MNACLDIRLETGPRSLTGHKLAGAALVRMIFFDAAGLSNPLHEPYIVVAGVIIHGDKQWKPLGDYLAAMADEYAPPEHRDNFVFHATELFSGGKIFPRDKYPKEWRWKILDELVSIPAKFDLPVVWGGVPRALLGAPGPDGLEVRGFNGRPVKPVIGGQMIAFVIAAKAAEHWMNLVAGADEIASMYMENDDQSREFIRITQRMIANPKIMERLGDEGQTFKLTRIVSPMHFEEKTDSSALQVADVCAFVLKRKMMKAPEAARFCDPIESFLVNKLRAEAGKASP